MKKYGGGVRKGSKIKIKERQQKKSWQPEFSGPEVSPSGVPKWVSQCLSIG